MISLASTYDPASVLIVVNDLAGAEAGTNGIPASQYIGQYYATRRGIPTSNILHLSIPLAVNGSDPHPYDSWTITWTSFVTNMRNPVKTFLETNNLKTKIKYIVPIYGVPTHLLNLGFPLPPNQVNANFPIEAYSIDSFLAAMYAGTDQPWIANPYAVTDPMYFKSPIRLWTNPKGWPLYLVCRLDGPTAQIALGLIDKAISAETTMTKTSGTAYFDWRNVVGPYQLADMTVVSAYSIALSKGIPSVLNNQNSGANPMISSAPNTAWAWGWYSGQSYCDGCYQFVNGAVGAQLTSYTAASLRQFKPGAWVPMWLRDGITATWGATGEPYTDGYAKADNLYFHFWNGYNFAEAAYQATPHLNWMMVFVGDPLYSPAAFNTVSRSRTTPVVSITAPNVNGAYYAGGFTVSMALPASPAVSSVQYTYNGYVLSHPVLNTPPYAVTFATDANDNGPGVFSAIVNYTNGTMAKADPLPIVIANP